MFISTLQSCLTYCKAIALLMDNECVLKSDSKKDHFKGKGMKGYEKRAGVTSSCS